MSRRIVVTVRMLGSSESWEHYQHPHPWHSRAGGGAVHSISIGLSPYCIAAGWLNLVYPDSSIVRKTACHGAILGFVMGHDLRRLFVSQIGRASCRERVQFPLLLLS